MNNKDNAIMRAWANIALQNEGYDPRRDAVARFILKNVDDPYEGIKVGSACIVKFEGEERLALRGEAKWFLCETDESMSDASEVVEVVSELVPKDDTSPLIPEEDWQNASDEHPKVLETEEDYRGLDLRLGRCPVMAEPDFIKKHPVPWSVAEGYFDKWVSKKADGIGMENQAILDANGGQVIRTHDSSGYQSWFAGDVDEFIAFVNEHFANRAEEGTE